MTATIHQFYEWPYQARITVANPSATAGFQAQLTLPWLGGMQRNFSDIRFFSPKGESLPYWIETKTDGVSATVWIAMPAGDAWIWMLFGNPEATDASDGDSVFDFFDDFLGSSVDSAKWDMGGTPTVASSMVTVDATSEYILSKSTYGVNTVLEASGNIPASKYFYIGYASAHEGVPLITIQWAYPTLSVYNSRTYNTGAEATNIGSGYTGTRRWSIHRNGSASVIFKIGASTVATHSSQVPTGNLKLLIAQSSAGGVQAGSAVFDWICIRKYTATEPTLTLDPAAEPNPYALTEWFGISAEILLALGVFGDVIRFTGFGSVEVIGDEITCVVGAGVFSIETTVRSPIPIAGDAALATGLNLVPASAAVAGTGATTSGVDIHTPIDMEGGIGSAYVAPAPIQFDVWQYKFESLDISRSAQDALWRCNGQIDGLQAPLAYKSFEVRVPDHNDVLRTIFFGFVPGRDFVQAVAANKSTVQGYDAGFYLTRQYLPDGDLFYPAEFLWTPMNLIKYWLGEEATWAGSQSYWERITGIMPYRIHNPSTYDHPYTPKDWIFQPKTTKMQAIQEVCEYSSMVFLAKRKTINGVSTPCAYLVHQDDIDHSTHGLDLPTMATFTHPDPCIANGIRVTLRSDEQYNRIEVRSASPSGAWFHAVRKTPALQAGDELPIEYLEERADLPIDANHGGWCNARADELYAYYTAYSYTYTLTLIDRTDLELYQRCQFSGFDTIPDGETMRIVSIRYRVTPTHTEVEIAITPDSRLSDLRRLQRSQAADAVSEIQTIAQGQIDQLAAGEVGTVVGIDGGEALIELERKTDSIVRGRIV